MKDKLSLLNKVKTEHRLYEHNFLNTCRIIVDLDLLLPLFNARCQHRLSRE